MTTVLAPLSYRLGERGRVIRFLKILELVITKSKSGVTGDASAYSFVENGDVVPLLTPILVKIVKILTGREKGMAALSWSDLLIEVNKATTSYTKGSKSLLPDKVKGILPLIREISALSHLAVRDPEAQRSFADFIKSLESVKGTNPLDGTYLAVPVPSSVQAKLSALTGGKGVSSEHATLAFNETRVKELHHLLGQITRVRVSEGRVEWSHSDGKAYAYHPCLLESMKGDEWVELFTTHISIHLEEGGTDFGLNHIHQFEE